MRWSGHTSILDGLRHSAKGFLSLAIAAGIVLGVLGYALAAMSAPSQQEREAGAQEAASATLAAQSTKPVPVKELPERHLDIYITGKRIKKPLMYRAKIDVHGWKDRAERVVDASIDAARPLERETSVIASAAAASAEAEYSDMLRGRRVYASVAAGVAQDMPAAGRAEVRLVVVPKGDAASLVIDKVVEPAPKTHKDSPADAIDPGSTSTTLTALASAKNGLLVTSLSRYYGSSGTSVTLTGSGFGATKGKSWVTCGGVAATVKSWSATRIVFTVPSKMTEAGYIGVVVGGKVSNGLFFAPAAQPVLDDIEPGDASPGTVVTLTGHNFGSKQGRGWVSMSGTSAQVVSWSDTLIRVIVPRNGTAGFVGVLTRGLSSNGRLFSPHGAPVVTSLSKRPLPIGDTVTITGRGFGSGGSVVLAGSRIKATSWSPTAVSFVVTEQMSSGYLGVLRSDGIVSNGLWVSRVPRVKSLSDWWAQPGDDVAIQGVGFSAQQGAQSAFVGGKEAAVIAWSPTKVTIRIADSMSSGYVGIGTRSACSNGRYLVIERKAKIDSIDQRFARADDLITVQGANFGVRKPTSHVLIAGRYDCPIQYWSDTKIQFKVPAGAKEGYLGVVKNGVSSNGVWLSVW